MSKKQHGFTIVELLIVIVVIAILAAISIVAYTGVQGRAHNTAVQNDLRNMGQILELYNIEHGYYPTPHADNGANMAQLGIRVSRDSYGDTWISGGAHNLFYCHDQNGQGDIALVASARSGDAWQYSGGTVSAYTGRASGGTTEICADAGAPTSSTHAVDRTLVRNNANWASWTQ